MADALLSLIREYREQPAINNATPDVDDLDEDALAEATFRLSYNRLCTSPLAGSWPTKKKAAAANLI